MSDPGANGAPRVHRQRFSVAFDYPVVFTRDAFSTQNQALLQALSEREPSRSQQIFAVLDDGVAGAWPGLAGAVAAYAAASSGRLSLVAPPLVVPGGEEAKNSST